MTYQEVLEKLKTAFDSVADFAFEDIPYDNNNLSEKAIQAEKDGKEWMKNNPTPKYGTEEYKIWNEEYKKLPSKYDIAIQEWREQVGLNWKEVEQYGGEGQGDNWYSVKYFPDHDVYIRVDGFYQSDYGTDFYEGWGCCSEVKKIQKTITVYE